MSRSLKRLRGLIPVSVAMCSVLFAGCATTGGGGPVGGGENCRAIKEQLNKLDAKGVPALVEAQTRGKKLPPAQKAEADTYNRLLNDYLGARCHVA